MRRPVIFWVEDNENDVLLVREAFSDLGVTVEFVVADNAMLAFRYLDSREPYVESPRPPDLVIVDLNLPALKGQAVLTEARRHLVLHGVPMVVLTSSSDPRELRQCLEIGAVECLTKPTTFDGYREVVYRLLRHLRDRDGTGSTPVQPESGGPSDDPPSSRICRTSPSSGGSGVKR